MMSKIYGNIIKEKSNKEITEYLAPEFVVYGPGIMNYWSRGYVKLSTLGLKKLSFNLIGVGISNNESGFHIEGWVNNALVKVIIDVKVSTANVNYTDLDIGAYDTILLYVYPLWSRSGTPYVRAGDIRLYN